MPNQVATNPKNKEDTILESDGVMEPRSTMVVAIILAHAINKI